MPKVYRYKHSCGRVLVCRLPRGITCSTRAVALGTLTFRLAIRSERLRRGVVNTAQVSVFNVVGCGNEVANLHTEYERQQPPHIRQPRRVCPCWGSYRSWCMWWRCWCCRGLRGACIRMHCGTCVHRPSGARRRSGGCGVFRVLGSHRHPPRSRFAFRPFGFVDRLGLPRHQTALHEALHKRLRSGGIPRHDSVDAMNRVFPKVVCWRIRCQNLDDFLLVFGHGLSVSVIHHRLDC